MGVVDRYYKRAGSSGMRRYKSLAGDWQRRMFGRRTIRVAWASLGLTILVLGATTRLTWQFDAGVVVGALAVTVYLLPEALLPDHIQRWQRGAWGEQNTAKALKKLRRLGWTVRHDLAAGPNGANYDHLIAGPAVYLLDTKLLKDEVWLDEQGLHVRRLDASGDVYVRPAPTRALIRSARALERDLAAAVGFPVAVYPVVVIWGHFDAGVQWDGQVAYVEGDRVLEWLLGRPADLHDPRKRDAVSEWLNGLPAA